MEPVPYEIREEDVDEVLDAYEPAGGGRWPEDRRREALSHVLANLIDLDDIVRSAPEDRAGAQGPRTERTSGPGDAPGDHAPARREMALAAIEDLLIRDGFIDLHADEERVFPATGHAGPERGEE